MSVINPNPFTTRPEIDGTFGVVASTHWIATAVGMATLEKGGNAFDAAVATAFTLQVVEPHLNGPGGDVPVIVHDVRRGKPEVICGQGPAPAGATIAHYRNEGLDLVPGTGLLAACVPGTFETWMLLLRDYGTMPLREVIAPAIGYAQNGHPLVERANATIATVADLFREHWPTSAAVYLPNGAVPATGTLFANKTLATTYLRILAEAESAGGDRIAQIEQARSAWSRGFVADAIDRFCRTQEVMDASGGRHRGVLTGGDMARWTPGVEAPLTYDYGRYTVCKTGPWGQGPVMLQQLALLKGFEIDRLDPAGADFIHLQVECAKLAFADREAFYGDPDFVSVPTATLLSDAYNSERRRLIGDTASLQLHPGSIEGFGAVIRLSRQGAPDAGAAAGAGEPTVGRLGGTRGDTVHFDIVDQAGNMVSATPSGGWLQSSPVIPELGFCLGTRAQVFWLDEDHPAALAPGKRPARRSHQRWRCATANLTSPAARRAATSRINGSPSFSCVTSMPASIFRKRSTRRPGIPSISRRRSGHARPDRACWSSRAACRGRPSPNSNAAATSSKSVRTGRKAGLRQRSETANDAVPPPIRAACKVMRRAVEADR